MDYRFLDEDHDEFDHHSEDELHHDDDHDSDKPWGPVIGAALLIQMVTFAGLLIVAISGCSRNKKKFWAFMHEHMIPSFASGALLATTVFLLIPEGFELLEGQHGEDRVEGHRALEEEEEEGHDDDYHKSAAWKFGVAFLSGFLIPILLGAVFPSPDTSECEQCIQRDLLENSGAMRRIDEDEDDDEVTDFGKFEDKATAMDDSNIGCDCCPPDDAKVDLDSLEHEGQGEKCEDKAAPVNITHQRNIALAGSILLGDFFHNFCDGIFIGTAFLLCSKTLAWTLTVTTIYHELAQEIADFALLTHHCGLTNLEAILMNFAAGFSVLIGALLVLSLDLTDTVIGALLTMSAGVYVYISATECIPRMQAARKTSRDTFIFLACFLLGAIPIGLVLLNHGHCDGEGEDDHDDH